MKHLDYVLLLLIAVLIWLTASVVALGYPENTRLGYSSCGSCHVSPTGGGALTAYGRSAGEELAAYSYEGAGRVAGLVDLPAWLSVGGDYRGVSVHSPTNSRSLFMQADLELAAEIAPHVWVDVSGGVYGPDKRGETRRNYLLWAPAEWVSVRVGKFFAGYGLGLPDHTASVRGPLGFGEGHETYNLELALTSPWGQLLVTDTFGGDEAVTGTPAGYRVRANEPGCAARAAVYLGTKAQVGASYWFHSSTEQDELVAGPFVNVGVTRNLYVLAEADRHTVTSTFAPVTPPPFDVTYTEVGYELTPGVHVQALHQYNAGSSWGVGVQLFPVPHAELVGRVTWEGGTWSSLVMTHTYW